MTLYDLGPTVEIREVDTEAFMKAIEDAQEQLEVT